MCIKICTYTKGNLKLQYKLVQSKLVIIARILLGDYWNAQTDTYTHKIFKS